MNFYIDPKSGIQKMAISKEVDMDYEKEVAKQQLMEQEIATLEKIDRN